MDAKEIAADINEWLRSGTPDGPLPYRSLVLAVYLLNVRDEQLLEREKMGYYKGFVDFKYGRFDDKYREGDSENDGRKPD